MQKTAAVDVRHAARNLRTKGTDERVGEWGAVLGEQVTQIAKIYEGRHEDKLVGATAVAQER